MFIVFQHPIIDFRNLIENNCKLSLPNWPNPEDENMIKHIGVTRSRLKGGIANWSGEHKYCTTNKAIQYLDLEKHKIQFGDNAFLTTNGVFRRLNSNGNFLVKYETGISNRFEEFIVSISARKNYFEYLLSEYCKLNLQIRNPIGENIISEISICGKYLSELYLLSTSSNWGIVNEKIERWWTIAGEPLIIVEFIDENKSIQLPKYVKLIKEYKTEKIELYHYWTNSTNNKKIRTWIIRILDEFYYDMDFVRNLRLNLLRINAEKETLRKTLNLLQRKGNVLINNDGKKEKVSSYLERISSKLLKEIRYGIIQDDILDIALKAEEVARPGELESYIETLTPLKNKYINSNVEQIINKGTIINVCGGEVHEINITENGDIIKNGDTNKS